MQFDNSSPIWLQLVDECSRRIVTGQWPAGSKLPGVRDLGVELGVNPNTIQRAMGELDRMGVTVPDRTKGRFVTDDTTVIDELRERVATGHADEFVRRAQGLGMQQTRALELLKQRWRQLEGEQS
ncbi:GntR family transcriptional regulator [Tessaracoccus timonensis]|uniref:GntR family transcriptional regulator n=1 Tax=Tessaracoccus timonensis TaxID=2161816 RepID=UPI000D55790C|nr:GntR family transcriptional regulator [Tessaracoccus timonensis]MDU7360252.1 GntR family transcriptional regulator [Propionibacteriaceae bacterium]